MYDFTPATAKDYESEEVELFRDLHAQFILKGFEKMPRGMTGLDSGQPWFIYWLSQALETLNSEGVELTPEMRSRCVSYLAQCQNHDEGGFGGAPKHISHLASTYAAILAVVNIGTEEAY